MTRPAPAPGALAPLLSQLFDDAGLFPPASLPWDEALAGNADVRAGPWGWMLGRFVCPIDHLSSVPAGLEVSLVVSAPSDVPEPGAPGAAAVGAIECRPGDADPVALREAGIAIGVADVFLEVAPRADAVAALAGTGVGAKLRCGGADAAAFPSAVALADALAAAGAEGVRLKATAGLHHPFRHREEETGFLAHGFLNVLAASAAAMAGADQPAVLDALEDPDPASFTLSGARFGWGAWTVDATGAQRLRRDLLTSIGTCSFTEPMDHLRNLGVLA